MRMILMGGAARLLNEASAESQGGGGGSKDGVIPAKSARQIMIEKMKIGRVQLRLQKRKMDGRAQMLDGRVIGADPVIRFMEQQAWTLDHILDWADRSRVNVTILDDGLGGRDIPFPTAPVILPDLTA